MKGIPEENYSTQNLIKRRRRNDEVNQKRAEGRIKDIMMAQRKNKDKANADKIKDPEFFAKKYRTQQRHYVVYKRKKNAVKNKTANVEKSGNTSILAFRVKASNNSANQEKGILNSMNLTKKFNAVFIENTVSNLEALKKSENCVVYGYPTKNLIEDLIRLRGFAKVDEKKVPLADNNIIEEALKDIDIICVDDLVDSIYKNQNIERINKFIYTFLLTSNKKQDNRFGKTDKPRIDKGILGLQKPEVLDRIIRSYF